MSIERGTKMLGYFGVIWQEFSLGERKAFGN